MDKAILLQCSFLLIIKYINYCSSDISFLYFKSHIQKFLNNTQKTWHNYIRMFLHRYLKNSQTEYGILQMHMLKMYMCSITFLTLKDKPLNLIGQYQGITPYKSFSSKGNVTWTSGQIYIFNSESIKSYYQFYFNLNPKLQLNMTFVVLHLRGSTVHCHFDKLEIKNLKENKSKYKYCGYHSKLNIYPEFNHFMLSISLKLLRLFELDAIFSVTDKSLIFNKLYFPLTEHGNNLLINQECYKIGGMYYLISFLIHITEIHRVKLSIVNSTITKYIIYDGPGYIFDVLSAKNKDSAYIASTHQCFLQFFTPYLIKTIRQHVDFNEYFPSKETLHINITSTSETLLHVPFNNCLHN